RFDIVIDSLFVLYPDWFLKSDYVDTGHHAVVFVFQIVTMKQVAPTKPAPTHDHIDLLTVIEGNGIFPSAFMSTRRATIAAEDLKRREVGVSRMDHGEERGKAAIDEAPHLDVTQLWVCVDAIRIKRFSVDQPMHARRQAELRCSVKDE